MEPKNLPHKATALIVGVTGMVGVSLAESLKSPTAIGGPWKVYGAARRPLPPWFPSSTLDNFIAFDATNFPETNKKLSPLANEITHVFWVALQVGKNEQENIKTNKTMLENVLHVLLKTPIISPLKHVTLQTGTKHYMGPIFQQRPCIPHETPFKENMERLPYPNFYYSLEDTLFSHSQSFSYSVHRSSILIGASSRSIYNTILTFSVYATICKFQGSKFRFPGNKYTWEHFCDMSDARILAEQQIWACVTEEAKNQAFNCTNGDVISWKIVWKALSDIFEVEFVPFDESEEFDWLEEMTGKEEVWDKIVGHYGLYKTKFKEITCLPGLKAILHFGFQHVSCMNKSREFGFFGFVDTLKSLGFWVGRLREMRIIP